MDTDMCQKSKGLVQACGVNDSLNQIGSSCRFKHLRPGKLVQACRVKYVWNQLGSNKLLTRQAYTSLPGQGLFEPIWCKHGFKVRPRKLVQACSVKYVLNQIDSLVSTHSWHCKLIQACRVKDLLNKNGASWFNNSVTRQACASLPKLAGSHMCWTKLVQVVQMCTSCVHMTIHVLFYIIYMHIDLRWYVHAVSYIHIWAHQIYT